MQRKRSRVDEAKKERENKIDSDVSNHKATFLFISFNQLINFYFYYYYYYK